MCALSVFAGVFCMNVCVCARVCKGVMGGGGVLPLYLAI